MYQAQKNPVWLEYAVTCYLQVGVLTLSNLYLQSFKHVISAPPVHCALLASAVEWHFLWQMSFRPCIAATPLMVRASYTV